MGIGIIGWASEQTGKNETNIVGGVWDRDWGIEVRTDGARTCAKMADFDRSVTMAVEAQGPSSQAGTTLPAGKALVGDRRILLIASIHPPDAPGAGPTRDKKDALLLAVEEEPVGRPQQGASPL